MSLIISGIGSWWLTILPDSGVPRRNSSFSSSISELERLLKRENKTNVKAIQFLLRYLPVQNNGHGGRI